MKRGASLYRCTNPLYRCTKIALAVGVSLYRCTFFKKKLLKKLHNSNNIVTFALCLRVHLFMKVSELWRMLERAGCTIHRRGGNHDIWYSPITGKKFPVSRHKTEDLKPKTLASIKEKAGI